MRESIILLLSSGDSKGNLDNTKRDLKENSVRYTRIIVEITPPILAASNGLADSVASSLRIVFPHLDSSNSLITDFFIDSKSNKCGSGQWHSFCFKVSCGVKSTRDNISLLKKSEVATSLPALMKISLKVEA